MRVGFDLSVDCVFELEKFCVAVYSFRSHESGNFIEVGNVVDVFPARKTLVNGVVVGDVAHFHFCLDRLFDDVVSANGYRAAVKRKNTRKALYRSGFARAVLSEKSENLARAQFKRYIVNRDSVALWIGFFKCSTLSIVILLNKFFWRFRLISAYIHARTHAIAKAIACKSRLNHCKQTGEMRK